MAGPLFRELAEGLSDAYDEGCFLLTGHPDTLSLRNKVNQKLYIKSGRVPRRATRESATSPPRPSAVAPPCLCISHTHLAL